MATENKPATPKKVTRKKTVAKKTARKRTAAKRPEADGKKAKSKKSAVRKTATTKKGGARKPRKKQTILTLQYYRSAIGFSKDQKLVVKGLGFRRLNATREFQDTPAVRGMVQKVPHLVRVVG